MPTPTITCLIPTHNRPQFLRRLLNFYEQFPPGFPISPDAASAIAIALADAWSASRRGIIDHEAIRDATVSRYCIEAMVAGFLQAVLGPTNSQLRPTRPSTKST